jgi:hypothetical protein
MIRHVTCSVAHRCTVDSRTVISIDLAFVLSDYQVKMVPNLHLLLVAILIREVTIWLT